MEARRCERQKGNRCSARLRGDDQGHRCKMLRVVVYHSLNDSAKIHSAKMRVGWWASAIKEREEKDPRGTEVRRGPGPRGRGAQAPVARLFPIDILVDLSPVT